MKSMKLLLGAAVLLFQGILSSTHAEEAFEPLTTARDHTGCVAIRYLISRNVASASDKKWGRILLDFVHGGPTEFLGKNYGVDVGERSPTPVSTKKMKELLKEKDLIRWAGASLIGKLKRYLVLLETLEREETRKRLASLDTVGTDPLVVSYPKEQDALSALLVKKIHLKTEDIGNDCD